MHRRGFGGTNKIFNLNQWFWSSLAILGLQLPVLAQPPAILTDSFGSEWERATIISTLKAHSETITQLRFSPDGSYLASVEPSAIAIWEVATGELLRILPGHYSTELGMALAPTDVAFSPDSRFLATATWSQGLIAPEKSILIWDIKTGEEVLTLTGETGCRQVLFSPDGDRLYGACGSGVRVWDFPTGEKLFSFDTEFPNEAIALSPDGEVMATADANLTGGQQGEQSNHIQLWNIKNKTATLLTTLSGHNNDIAQLAFTKDNRRLVSSSYDGEIKVWNWKQGVENPYITNLTSHNGGFSLSENNRLIAGNFPTSTMANLSTGLPLETPVSIPQAGRATQAPQPSAGSPLEFDSGDAPLQASSLAFSPQEPIFAWAGKPPTYPNPVIFLWQAGRAEPLVLETALIRDDYTPLNLSQVWGRSQSLGQGEITQAIADKIEPIGKDPQAIALAALGLKETVESEQQQVAVDYPQDNQAVVTITQTQLADDSVFGIRYRVEFAPYSNLKDEQWRVIWAGKQYKCRANRGHQDWSTDLCL